MIRAATGIVFLVLLVGCGGKGEAPAPGGRPVSPPPVAYPPPSRAPLDLPAERPSRERRIDFYLGLLSGGAPDELEWAGGQLREAGEAAVPALSDRLGKNLGKASAENYVRAFAEWVVPRGATEVLLRAAADRSDRIRAEAARALGRTGDPVAVPALLDLLMSGISRIGLAALDSLSAIGTESAVRGLLGRFPDRMSPDVAAAAVEVLAARLPAGERDGFLKGALRAEDTRVALVAARAMLRRGGDGSAEAGRYLHSLLAAPYGEAAMEALSEARDPVAMRALIDHATSSDVAMAIFSIGNLGRYDAPEARAALWKLTKVADAERRREAFHSLAISGDPDALPAIRGMLSSRDPADRLVAALVLGALKDPESLPQLMAATETETDRALKLKLANAVALLGRPEGLPLIARVFLSDEETDPASAILANQTASMLMRSRELPPEAVALLRAGARSPNPALRMNAARALARAGLGRDSTADLAALLTDESVHVRRAAVAAWPLLDGATVEPLHAAYRREGDGRLAAEMEMGIRKLLNRWREE